MSRGATTDGVGTDSTSRRGTQDDGDSGTGGAPRRVGLSRGYLAAAITALIVFVAYVLTITPGFADLDNAELIVAVHVLGVPHPTGYPLLLLLSKALELLLPMGTVIYRLDLVSALYGAGAAAALAWVAATVTGSTWCGLCAGLLAGLGRGLWTQSVQLSVFSLHALLIALLLAAIVVWEENRTRRRATVVALVIGLGMAHHRTFLFFAVPAWLLCWRLTPERDWRLGGKMALAAMAPSLLHLLLIPLAARHPAMNWGSVQLGWRYWYWHITGRQFMCLVLAQSAREAWANARGHWLGLVREYTPLMPLLAVLGFAAARRQVLRLVAMCGCLLSLTWAYWYGPGNRLTYALPGELVLVLWAAIGLGVIGRGLSQWSLVAERRWRPGIVPVIVMVLAVVACRASLRALDARSYRARYDLTLGTLEAMPSHAILLTDIQVFLHGAYPYFQHIAGVRRDVTVVPMDFVSGYSGSDNITDPIAREAVEYARQIAQEDNSVFWQRMLSRLMTIKGARRVFVQPPLFGQWMLREAASRLVWKGYGNYAEILRKWPELEAPAPGELPPGKGLTLVSAEVEPSVVKPGGLLRIRFRWQVAERIEHLQRLTLAFRTDRPETGQAETTCYSSWPFLYGKVPVEPNRPGHVYVQEVLYMMPTQAPPGEYRWMLAGANAVELPGTVTVKK